jgi:ZipA, C-terminal FtsZ-binding domain
MSELQFSLLVIGIAVVLLVYGYNAWQQRLYRRRFGAAFKPRHGDALYQGGRSFGDLPDPLADKMEQALPEESILSSASDEACKTLSEETDYIAVMFAATPLHASVLAPLWHRRFDFGKNIYVCGVREAGGGWEKVVAESPVAYDTLRVALQLADRNGAVSETRLSYFRDMLRDIADEIQAEVNLPDVVEAAVSARKLDEFCAEVDQMIGLNILAGGERKLMGNDIARVATMHGLTLQADGSYYLLDARGHTLFVLTNYDNIPFQHHTLNQARASGLSLLLDVPRVENPAHRFDEMAQLAAELAEDLRAAVVDDQRVALSADALAMVRGQIVAIERRMQSYSVNPGSLKARRLFF